MEVRRHVIAYGTHRDQWGELFLPQLLTGATPLGTVVVIHGGYWRDTYTAELGVPAALDLAARGCVVWNLEYRRAGANGSPGAGGWPATFEDVAAGIDALGDVARQYLPGLGKVVALGHSAGGHLAVWAAGRSGLPEGAPGAGPGISLTGVVSQAGVLDLGAAWQLGLSNGAVENLLGTAPPGLTGQYRLADPLAQLPVGVPVHAVHSRGDAAVPFGISEKYCAAAAAAGDPVELHETSGDHFALITPGLPAYGTCRRLVLDLLSSN